MNTADLPARGASPSRLAPRARAMRLPRASWAALALAGLALLAAPALWELAHTTWRSDEQGHGPVLLVVALWLIWQRRQEVAALPRRPWPRLGGALLLAALAAAVLGGSQRLLALQVLAPWLAGVGLLAWTVGPAALRRVGVPLICLLLVVPVAGMVVQQVTLPLKLAVSDVAEQLLHAAGLPVARTGVVLAIDQYQLLVADACAGLTSMFTLEAMGLVYIELRGHTQVLRQALLALLIVPIAFVANVVRVCLLVLVTWQLGDAAGRGFTHSLAGVLLFVVAMLLMLLADAVLGRVLAARSGAPPQPPQSSSALHAAMAPAVSRRVAAVALLLPAVAGPLGELLRPTRRTADIAGPIDLETQVPLALPGWRLDPSVVPVLPDPRTQATLEAAYSQVLARTYIDRQGRRVMLSVAYGNDQGADATAVHRPEFCYRSLGFEVDVGERHTLALQGRRLTMRRLLARRDLRVEPVSYWVTLDRTAALPGWDRKRQQLAYGLRGWIPDGMVVRVSTLGAADEAAYALLETFVTAVHDAMAPDLRARYFGAGVGP
jgi:exosortase B